VLAAANPRKQFEGLELGQLRDILADRLDQLVVSPMIKPRHGVSTPADSDANGRHDLNGASETGSRHADTCGTTNQAGFPVNLAPRHLTGTPPRYTRQERTLTDRTAGGIDHHDLPEVSGGSVFAQLDGSV
jgi:hypothetical protein